jgi:hypothetical protein
LDLIVDRFGGKLPSYSGENAKRYFLNNIESSGSVSIFGPSVQLGHSMVVNRVIIDVLKKKDLTLQGSLANAKETPLMPTYVAMDLASLDIQLNTLPKSNTIKVA